MNTENTEFDENESPDNPEPENIENPESFPSDEPVDEVYEAEPEAEITETKKAEMSEVATLGNIFFEPGRTFKDLRIVPRFILGAVLTILMVSIYNFVFIQKVGYENLVASRIDNNSSASQISSTEKAAAVKQQATPMIKNIEIGATPVVLIVYLLLGGLLYWAGIMAFGGTARFTHGLSVWVYSGLPQTILVILGNLLVLFLKSPDEVNPAMAQTYGLIPTNPGFFIEAKEMPVLKVLLSSLDLFAIWGWILAAIGLRIVGKISSGTAWMIVLFLALIGITLKVVGALLFA
jgi:hypothetical protein